MAQHSEVTGMIYHCPNCKVGIEVEEDFIGSTVECPNCSMPFHAKVPEAAPVAPVSGDGSEHAEFSVATPTNDESELVLEHPALFRRHPLKSLGLAVAGIGAIAMAIAFPGNTFAIYTAVIVFLVIPVFVGYWWLEVIATTLTVTTKRTQLRHGIFSKSTTEVQHDDVRNLQVRQNVIQRLLKIGDIAISSSGQDDLEIFAEGIPHPNEIADLVRKMQ